MGAQECKTQRQQYLLDRSTRGTQGDVEQLGLPSNDHASVSSKLEVGSSGSSVNLANELGGGVVDPDTVTGTSVQAALGVGVNT